MEDFKEKTNRCQMAAQLQVGKCLSSGSTPHPFLYFSIALICCVVLPALHLQGFFFCDSSEKEVREQSPAYKHGGFLFEFQHN